MIQLICFDIDNTLMDFHKGEKIAFYETMKQLNVDVVEKDYLLYDEINQALWRKLEKGEVEKNRLRTLRFEQFKDVSGLDFDVAYASTLFVENLALQCFLYEESEEVVKECALKCDLALATNGIATVQRSRIKKSGLQAYFKYIFISEEIGVAKPSPIFFEKIFEVSGLKPQQILFVGDSLSADISGAVQSGCVSVWFNPDHIKNHTDIQSDYEIDSLASVLDILEELR